MINVVRALLELDAVAWSDDGALWVRLDEVLELCRFRVRGAELYLGEGVSTEGASWAMETQS